MGLGEWQQAFFNTIRCSLFSAMQPQVNVANPTVKQMSSFSVLYKAGTSALRDAGDGRGGLT
jgi:hypothetical protein